MQEMKNKALMNDDIQIKINHVPRRHDFQR